MLGTELGFSAKVVCASNCGATSWPPVGDSCSVKRWTRADANKALFPMLTAGMEVCSRAKCLVHPVAMMRHVSGRGVAVRYVQ